MYNQILPKQRLQITNDLRINDIKSALSNLNSYTTDTLKTYVKQLNRLNSSIIGKAKESDIAVLKNKSRIVQSLVDYRINLDAKQLTETEINNLTEKLR